MWTFVTYQPVPNLSIHKAVATTHNRAELGEVVTYTLTLSNTGDGTANSVVITDVLPASVTFGGFVQQNGPTFSNGIVLWNGSIAASASTAVVFFSPPRWSTTRPTL